MAPPPAGSSAIPGATNPCGTNTDYPINLAICDASQNNHLNGRSCRATHNDVVIDPHMLERAELCVPLVLYGVLSCLLNMVSSVRPPSAGSSRRLTDSLFHRF